MARLLEDDAQYEGTREDAGRDVAALFRGLAQFLP
jgi:hypothetical protein